jgi:hypothetical protein
MDINVIFNDSLWEATDEDLKEQVVCPLCATVVLRVDIYEHRKWHTNLQAEIEDG